MLDDPAEVAKRRAAFREFIKVDPRADLPDRPATLDSPAAHSFTIGEDEFIAGSAAAVGEQIIAQCRTAGAGHFAALFDPLASPAQLADLLSRLRGGDDSASAQRGGVTGRARGRLANAVFACRFRSREPRAAGRIVPHDLRSSYLRNSLDISLMARAKFTKYTHPAGGWGSVQSLGRSLTHERVPLRGTRILLHQNKPDGFACVSCSWAKPAKPHPFEFCEEGAKATTWEITSRRCGPDFFAEHTVTLAGKLERPRARRAGPADPSAALRRGDRQVCAGRRGRRRLRTLPAS